MTENGSAVWVRRGRAGVDDEQGKWGLPGSEKRNEGEVHWSFSLRVWLRVKTFRRVRNSWAGWWASWARSSWVGQMLFFSSCFAFSFPNSNFCFEFQTINQHSKLIQTITKLCTLNWVCLS